MQRYFIADVHLNNNEPVIATGFLHFLEQLPNNCELYILGDLFDYWIGDDLADDLQLQVSQALKQLTTRGIQSYFIHGNRDFLLGQRYAKLSGMTILPEVKMLNEHIILLHGDLLCTDDESYQKFRKKMHCKWLQTLFLALPRYFRRKIANKLRNKSKQHNQSKAEYIMDVNQQTVSSMMHAHQATVMIHGHTHKPATHHFELDGKSVSRIVLGAWHDGVNYIEQNDEGNITLIK